MARDLVLPSGIRVRKENNKLMLDFSFKGVRYRPITKLDAIQPNVRKAIELLTLIKADLERDQFFIGNYEDKFIGLNKLVECDNDYIASQKFGMNVLIEEQFDIYRQLVSAGNMAMSTYEGYRYANINHIIPHFGNLDINEITPQTIEKWIMGISMSRSRTKTIITPLRAVFARAKRRGVININPFDNIDKQIQLTSYRNSEYHAKPFNQDEIKAILDSCDYECIKNFIEFGFWTGMRISEIFALQWSDIDFENELIHVSKSQTFNKELKAPKSKAGYREIEMLSRAKAALLRQYEITGCTNSPRVFLTPTGKIYSKPDTFGRHWHRILVCAKVERRNPYQMRHTFISYMLSIGNSPMDLYRMVGHKTPEIIYEHYARSIRKSGKVLKE